MKIDNYKNFVKNASLSDLVELAEFLDKNGVFNKASDVVRFFEKPWKWEVDYAESKT
jgi:hypothetical protein